jgi:hypothetical protein
LVGYGSREASLKFKSFLNPQWEGTEPSALSSIYRMPDVNAQGKYNPVPITVTNRNPEFKSKRDTAPSWSVFGRPAADHGES